MKKISFTIDRIPPSLNVMLRMHYQQRKRQQSAWDLIIMAYWLEARKFVFNKPVKISYTICFASKRKRDYDNYLGGTKFINDALKRTFLTEDDSTMLKKIEIGFLNGSEEQTIVHIEEVE